MTEFQAATACIPAPLFLIVPLMARMLKMSAFKVAAPMTAMVLVVAD